MLDEWEQRRQDDLARDIFGDDGEVGYYDDDCDDDYDDDKPNSTDAIWPEAFDSCWDRNSCLTSLYILCGKDSASIRNSLQLAI